MDKSCQPTRLPGELLSLSLAEVEQCAVEARFAGILESSRHDLAAALQSFQDEGLAGSPTRGVERLAWAIACNVEGPPPPANAKDTSRGIRGYRDRWPLETPWSTIWSALSSPLTQAKPGDRRTFLSELSLSVLCEQRGDWQPGGTRPMDLATAQRAFEFVYARDSPKVLGDLYKSFGNRLGSPEAIAQEAWSRVFCDYWSSRARRRFLGLCCISTLISQVARFVAIDAIRERSREEPAVIERNGERRDTPALEELGVTIDPGDDIAAEQLEVRIQECMKQLPTRRRIVAEMVWFREVRAKRAAEILRVSEAAVSQHLKAAREGMRCCLAERGFGGPRK